MNKKINCDLPLKDLSGKEIPDGEGVFTLGKALSNVVITNKSGGKMKLYSLGTKFYAGGEVELDAADFALVMGAVKSDEVYNALVGGQIETILESL